MAGPIHTYNSTCFLADDDPDLSTWYSSPTPPKARPQFFYTSSLPIDDPSSSLPPPQSEVNEKAPPQPFSAKDHIALEDAWRTLRETVGRKAALKAGIQERTSMRNSFVSVPGLEASRLRQAGSRDGASPFESQQNSPNISGSALEAYNAKVRANYRASGADVAPRSSWEGLRVPSRQGYEAGDGAESASIGIIKRERPSFSHNFKPTRRRTSASAHDEAALDEGDTGSGRTTPRDVSISGSPFVRAPLVPPSPLGRSLESGHGIQELHTATRNRDANTSGVRSNLHQEDPLDDAQTESGEQPGDENMKAKIPVGVSRLHLVELPNLKVLLISITLMLGTKSLLTLNR